MATTSMRVADSYKPIGEALTIARGEANIGMYDSRVVHQLNKIVALLESVPVPVVAIDDAEGAELEAKRDYHLEDMVRTGLTLDQARAILCALEAYR